MQCLQYLFYHQLPLQKHRICVKGHQILRIHSQTPRILPRRDRPTALIFLDPPLNAVTYFEHCYNSQFFIQNDKMGSYICFAPKWFSCTRRLVIFLGLDFRSTLACVYIPLSFWHNVKESGV